MASPFTCYELDLEIENIMEFPVDGDTYAMHVQRRNNYLHRKEFVDRMRVNAAPAVRAPPSRRPGARPRMTFEQKQMNKQKKTP